MQVITVKSVKAKVRKVRKLMESVGNQFGAVWFIRRKDGKLRKMAYRLHVQHPSYEKVPTGKKFLYKKALDSEKNLLTVFDTNTLRYNNKKRLCGRGGFRSVPLDGVVRLKVNGEIYKIIS